MLKALLLRTKIDAAQKELDTLLTAKTKRETRAAALEADIKELAEKADATAEERSAVETAVEALEAEATKGDEEIRAAQTNLDALKEELRTIEATQKAATPQAVKEPVEESTTTRKDVYTMPTFKIRAINNMTAEQRDAFASAEYNKRFAEQIRALTATPNANVLVPREDLPMLYDTVERYSKLIKHINKKSVKGQARQRVFGTVPEAVWTEQGGNINELAMSADGTVEIDGYKVAGFLPIDNWLLKDNDVELIDAVLDALAQAVAKGVDKAIPFGTGSHMPKGFVTAILADEALAATNKIDISAANSTGLKLFQNLLKASGAAVENYSDGEMFWAMNSKTYKNLVAEALTINAAGAIVSGMGKEMPVIGGAVEQLSFIPDNIIVGGYGSLYLLGEREGCTIAASAENRFTQDQTVYRAIARYDGKPVKPEGFVLIGINGTAAATAVATVTFAQDTANT